MDKNFYEILGVSQKATAREISEAYRNFVLKNHPDRFVEASEKRQVEEQLKDVTEAYNTLSKPNLRAKYDEEIAGVSSSVEQAAKKPPKEQAREYYQQAMAALQGGDFTAALSLFDYALRLTPEDTQALFQAGMIRLKNPKWRVKGAQQVEEAIQKDPFNAKYVMAYAKFLIESGQSMRAERILDQAYDYHKADPAFNEFMAGLQGDKKGGSGFSLFGKKK